MEWYPWMTGPTIARRVTVAGLDSDKACRSHMVGFPDLKVPLLEVNRGECTLHTWSGNCSFVALAHTFCTHLGQYGPASDQEILRRFPSICSLKLLGWFCFTCRFASPPRRGWAYRIIHSRWRICNRGWRWPCCDCWIFGSGWLLWRKHVWPGGDTKRKKQWDALATWPQDDP